MNRNSSNKRHKKVRVIDLDPIEQSTTTVVSSHYPESSLFYGQSHLDQIRQQIQQENKMIMEQYMRILTPANLQHHSPAASSILQFLQHSGSASPESCMNSIFSEINQYPSLRYNFPFTPYGPNITGIGGNNIFNHTNGGTFLSRNQSYHHETDLTSLLDIKRRISTESSAVLVQPPPSTNDVDNDSTNNFWEETDSFTSYL